MAFAIIVPLAVRTAAEPGLGEYTVLDLALFLECDFVFENIEFGRQMRGHLAGDGAEQPTGSQAYVPPSEKDDKAVFTVAYVVRAVSPGKYVLPQAYVEDMYNPSRYGRSGTGTVEVRPAK